MFNIHQHWDPLKVCIVGKSYPPEFYKFVNNPKVRTVLERIAIETEEDYQKLIALLESFGVLVLRPNVLDEENYYLRSKDQKYEPPRMMTPCDYSIMFKDKFYFKPNSYNSNWDDPQWGHILDYVRDQGNEVVTAGTEAFSEVHFNRAIVTRVGRDIYAGSHVYNENLDHRLCAYRSEYPEYRFHGVDTGGHSDGTFCPVKPGLIVSLQDIPTYKDTFPGWEVVYLPGQSWGAMLGFLKLKEKNKGKWWVPGQELNNEFTDFVESWLNHWVGYVEETVFDVNMLVIDEKNVVCNNYNRKVFKAFERHGITPHIVNFRHRYFWDGGLHCITSDLHREGTLQDYFPERN